MSSMETSEVFLLLFSCVGVRSHNALPLSGILSVCEIPEWLRGLENVTKAFILNAVSSKWVKF